VLAVACSGTKFTGVSDDASAPVDGGSNPGPDASPTDAANDGSSDEDAAPIPCTFSLGGGGCPGDQFCDAPGCGPGTCAKTVRLEGGELKPVCGCDKLTYWNNSVARSHAMSVAADGECASGRTCGPNARCSNGASCNAKVSACTAVASGTCWVLPASCPSSGLNPKTRQCLASSCAGECDLIKSEKAWYDDPTCP
jgi:hypothetical protein